MLGSNPYAIVFDREQSLPFRTDFPQHIDHAVGRGVSHRVVHQIRNGTVNFCPRTANVQSLWPIEMKGVHSLTIRAVQGGQCNGI